MAFLAKGKKCDLAELATELGVEVKAEHRIIDLKRLITTSKDYDEEFAKGMLERIIVERVETEKKAEEAKERADVAERDERDKERKHQLELEKLKIESIRPVGPVTHTTLADSVKTSEFSRVMQKYRSEDGDISSYLVLFERQAKRMGIKDEDYVTYLVGLLPYEVIQLITRESEQDSNNYSHVKALLLKRFKLSAERFRQKFLNHIKDSKVTWKDFAFDLRHYFDEWITGLNVKDFDSLKELVVTDQLKRRVPFTIREHFTDDWPKFVNSDELANKLDDYESVRVTDKTVQSRSRNFKYEMQPKLNFQRSETKSNQGSDSVKYERNSGLDTNHKFPERQNFSTSRIRNDKGEFKCFSCNNYGHISKNCTRNKIPTNKEEINSTQTKKREVSNLNISDTYSTSPDNYLKTVIIKNGTVSGLIDTGSSSCLLKQSIADKLNVYIVPCEKELFGFGNQKSPVTKTVGGAVLDITIGDVIARDVPVLIVNDDAQPVDLIVGRTLLELPYITYWKEKQNFNIGYSKEYTPVHVENNTRTSEINFKTICNEEIKSNSINLIKAKTEEIENGLILIESKDNQLGSLLKVVEGRTIVPIVNVGNENIKFRQNQNLCKVEEISYEDTKEINPNNLIDAAKNTGCEVLMLEKNEHKSLITLDHVNFDESLSKDQRLDIVTLLNEFRDCFAFELGELGCTDITQMEIKEVDGSKPVCTRPYKTNAAEREIIKKIVKEWKDHGIVSETRSPYASPVLLVKKKTGDYRLVVDYRRLNDQTIKDKYPLPKIDNLLECLSGVQIFSTLDLAHGYLQIPLTEDSKLKTAFITPDETGQFNRMIFGLANAPAEFQRLMNQVLGPLFLSKALCYMDDILIPATSWEDMMNRLREVLKCLRTAKLTLRLSKCEFGRQEVNFLGFVINSQGLKPGLRKIRAIEEFPEPQNVHDVRRYLGLTGFFRRFIRKYAQKAEPLSRLTRKNQEFVWSNDQRKAYQTLKEELLNVPVLAHYNPDAKTEVHTDASSNGLSGMIIQKEGKEWHLVYCVSKKTTDAERKYHSSKLELMAIVWTLDRLRQFLLGIKFTIVTDCQALVYMNAKKTTNPQIARWYDLIQEFDFTVQHRPGDKMSHVDALSRAPVLEAEDTLTNYVERNIEVCLTLTEDEQVLVFQNSDSELKELITILQKPKFERTIKEKKMVNSYVLKRNRLFRVLNEDGKEKLLYVVPKTMRKSIVVKFHDLMGHFSVDRTVNKIKERYWFPLMRRYVKKHISMCFECLVNKVPGRKQQGLLHPIKSGKRPFSVIHIDHLGPFVKSTKGNTELLVIIDNFTRFVKIVAVRNTSTKHVLKVLREFVNSYGLPDRIVSDRGSCFTSHQFENFCKENGIAHTLNSTKHPQGNGMVERVNRTIVSTVSTCMTDERHRDWDARLTETERNLNNMVNKTTNKTPFEMLHGYLPRFNDGIFRILTDEDADSWTEPSRIQEIAREEIEAKQEKMKKTYDKKKCRTVIYEPGEIVVVRRGPKTTGQPTKTQAKYRGPFVITHVLSNDTYRISDLGESKSGRSYSSTAHVSQLKAWHCKAESDEETESDEESDDQENPSQKLRRSPRFINVKENKAN